MPPKSSTQEQFSYCNKCKLLRTARLIPSDALQLYSIRAVYFRKTTGHKLYQFVIKYIVWNKFTWQQRLSFPRDSCMHAQLCPTLCNPRDCSLPGSSIHGIFQARILQWVAVPFSTGSSQPRDWTQVSHIADWFFTVWTTSKAPNFAKRSQIQGIPWWMNTCKQKTAKLVWRFKVLEIFFLFPFLF